MLHSFSPIIALVIFSIAYCSTYIFNKIFRLEISCGRNENIDGLRGFLAISVFMHHSSIWYQYFQIGEWATPKSNLYAQLGDTSVVFFFMITSFLFTGKILKLKSVPIHWPSFFITRFLRLAPMYLTTISILIFIVFYKTNFIAQELFLKNLEHIFNWIVFTIYKSPDINNYKFTNLINAGVTWSLTYEWLFYFTLPLISIFILYIKSNLKYYIGATIFIILFLKFGIVNIKIIFPFLGGAIAPILLHFNIRPINANKLFTNIILIAVLFCLLFLRKYAFAYILSYTTIFTIIALGNNVFGILQNKTLRIMGEISYSTYLIHGLLLFIIIQAMYNMNEIETKNINQFYCAIFLLTPALMFLSFCGYYFIEKPSINFGKKLISKNLK